MARKGFRAQIIGSIVVLAVAGLFVGVLPLVANAIPDPNELAGDQRHEFANGISLVVPDGWSSDPAYEDYGFVLLSKSGTTTMMSFTAPAEATGTAEDMIQFYVDLMENDVAKDWQVGETRLLETGAGMPIANVTGHSPDEVAEYWVASDGSEAVKITASSSDTMWVTIHDEMDGIVNSLQWASTANSQ